MEPLPSTERAMVLRTDFSDQAAWEAIRSEIRPLPPPEVVDPDPALLAALEFVDLPACRGMTAERARESLPADYRQVHAFFAVVDTLTLTHPERPVLVVDLDDEPGRTFRVLPAGLGSIDAGLSLGVMRFAEFADAADADGVFRGFQ